MAYNDKSNYVNNSWKDQQDISKIECLHEQFDRLNPPKPHETWQRVHMISCPCPKCKGYTL